jgi:hypothetical protein
MAEQGLLTPEVVVVLAVIIIRQEYLPKVLEAMVAMVDQV